MAVTRAVTVKIGKREATMKETRWEDGAGSLIAVDDDAAPRNKAGIFSWNKKTGMVMRRQPNLGGRP